MQNMCFMMIIIQMNCFFVWVGLKPTMIMKKGTQFCVPFFLD